MRIGILGGSFDPIHNGHLIVASYASQCGMLDEVWLMVSRRNPLKFQGTVASEQDRLEMAIKAVEGNERIKVSGKELKMPSPSYTYDTLCSLREEFPEHDFSLMIGSDSLENFSRWKNSDKILKEFGVIVYPRAGYILPEELMPGFKKLKGVPETAISSTFIREKVSEGWNPVFFVPESVAEFIHRNNLYKHG